MPNNEIIDAKFKIQIELDDIKNKKCNENNIELIYYTDTNYDYRYDIIRNIDDLIRKITR